MNRIIKNIYTNMRNDTVVTLCTICMLLLGYSSCLQKEENLGEEIPFAEYSLDGENPPNTAFLLFCNAGYYNPFGCNILTDGIDDYTNKVLLINSSEELEKYIVFTEIDIDFSIHSLLLAGGRTPNPVRIISPALYKKSSFKYILNVKKVEYGELDVFTGWIIVILMPKIKNEATISLKVDEK